jgi:hypothetical protein
MLRDGIIMQNILFSNLYASLWGEHTMGVFENRIIRK